MKKVLLLASFVLVGIALIYTISQNVGDDVVAVSHSDIHQPLETSPGRYTAETQTEKMYSTMGSEQPGQRAQVDAAAEQSGEALMPQTLTPALLGGYFTKADRELMQLSQTEAKILYNELEKYRNDYFRIASNFIFKTIVSETQYVLELRVPGEVRAQVEEELTAIVVKYLSGLSEANRNALSLTSSMAGKFLYPRAEGVVISLEFDSHPITDAAAVRIEQQFIDSGQSSLGNYKTSGLLTFDQFIDRWGILLGSTLFENTSAVTGP